MTGAVCRSWEGKGHVGGNKKLGGKVGGHYLIEGRQQSRGLAGEAEAFLHCGDGALEVAGDHELRQLQQAVAQDEELPEEPQGPQWARARETGGRQWVGETGSWGKQGGVRSREKQGTEWGNRVGGARRPGESKAGSVTNKRRERELLELPWLLTLA